jgi:PAS domain S-box-containing protein
MVDDRVSTDTENFIPHDDGFPIRNHPPHNGLPAATEPALALAHAHALLALEIERRTTSDKALLQAQNLLLDTQKIAHVGSWGLNLTTGAMQWSDEMFRICGREPQSVMPTLQLALDSVHPDDRQAAVNACAASRGSKLALRIVRPDGSIRHVESQVRNDDGALAARGTWLDVTDKKSLAEAQAQDETRYRSLINLSPDWFWETDQDLRFTKVTHRSKLTQEFGKRVLGCAYWELPGARWDAAAQLVLDADIAARRPFRDFDFCMACRDGDGEQQYLRASGEPVSDAGGRFTGYRGVARDVSELTKKEKHLQLFRRAMDATADAILVLDYATHKFFDVNVTVCRMLGYTREQLLMLDPLDIGCGARHQLDPIFHELINGKDFGLIEVALRRKDGSSCVVEMHRMAQRWGDHWLIVAMARDISERKRTDDELLRSQHALRQLVARQDQIKEQERKRIAREIHDELGQNLLALRIDVSMLHARSASSHPRLHKKVEIVLDTVDATIRSIKSIINDLRPQTLELGLRAAFEWQLQHFERLSGIACNLEVNDGGAVDPLDDERTLAVFRILQESLTNIARHARATKVDVVLNTDQTRILMTVTDNGIGLGPDAKRNAKGFGLVGIRERVASLGGDLAIDSLNGTELSVTIPLRRLMPGGWDRRRQVS